MDLQRHRRTVDTAPPASGLKHFGTRALLGLVALVAGALPFLLLLLLVQQSWPVLASLDADVAATLNAAVSRSSVAVLVLQAVTDLGGNGTAALLLGLATVFLLIRQQRRLAAYVVVTSAGMAVLVPVTKALVGRTRPVVASPVVPVPDNGSFPSGHAMISLITWGVLLLVTLPGVHRRVRPWFVATAALVVVAVGFTRLALGVHFVSDVVAGWALGLAWLLITTAAFRGWQHAQGRHTRSPLDPLEASGEGRPGSDRTQRPVLPDRPAVVVGRLTAVAALIGVGLCAMGLAVTGPLVPTALGWSDQEAMRFVVDLRTPWRTDVAVAVSALSGTPAVLAVSLVTAVVALAVTASWRPVVFVVVTVAGEVMLYFVVVQVVARARPSVRDLTYGLPTAASWPSGHTAAAVAVYGALAVLLATVSGHRARWAVLAVPVVVAAAVGLSRVYVAAHHPSDVVAGVVLGTTWLVSCAVILQLGAPGRGSPQGGPSAVGVQSRHAPVGAHHRG